MGRRSRGVKRMVRAGTDCSARRHRQSELLAWVVERMGRKWE
jgi:hypothetical protein